MMMKIIVAGAAGRMGCRLVALVNEAEDLSLIGAVEGKGHPSLGKDAGEGAGCGQIGVPIGDDLDALLAEGEVVIDFSAPSASLEHSAIAVDARRAMVIGTTGFSATEREQLTRAAQFIPLVLSPNMSLGVNVLFKTAAQMAKALGETYDLEIVEAHHRLKKDAPSGTALRLAQVLAEATSRNLDEVGVYARKGHIGERRSGEIGIQTLRAGDIVGDHTVLFGGPGERLELTHRAHSRDTFATGALHAARWVVQQPPGLYSMFDVLGME